MSDQSLNANNEGLRPRAYQLEMLEASLRQNIIVAMDTGSGKTQIAILRISKELETCPTGKIVWFLAPTVALCEQQHKALCLQLPNERTKLLVGRDNVDRWSYQYWDVALSGVRIVVSTHTVLLDALGHGFVTMARLALLVFDEAHSCTRNHPANKIMREFYHSPESPLDFVSKPKILGLTASPTIRSRPRDLQVIEANLDSITKTPCIYRDELLRYVHIPEPLKINYFEDRVEPQTWCPILKSLTSCIADGDESLKNHVLRLLTKDEIAKLPVNDIVGRKWTSKGQAQLRKFSDRARYIQEELGSWASDYYITESINRMTLSMHEHQNRCLGWPDEHTIHILNSLGRLHVPEPALSSQFQIDTSVSDKCAKILDFLVSQASSTFRGIIFVDQRVTVFVLSHILSVYPGTKDLFKCGTFVGISTNENKKMELRDLLDPQGQENTLKEFREGHKNLLIATTALEEGIDISACNVVICFNRPPNLKSYVQRRGRARKENSTIVLLSSLNNKADIAADWEKMEAEMIAEYMRDDRDPVEAEITALNEVDNDTRILSVNSTGAKLTLDEALKHLQHFCQHLSAYPNMNSLPVFVFTKEETTGLFSAQVTLPNWVHSSVRRASGLRAWPTENMARKDAAFQAYVALYNAGLLDDYLLPLKSRDMLLGIEVMEDLSSIVEIQQQYNPWHDVAKKWSIPYKFYWKKLNIQWAEHGEISMNLVFPVDIPSFQWPLSSSLDGIEYKCSIADSEVVMDTEIYDLNLLRSATKLVLQSVRDRCPMDYPDDFVALLIPQRVSSDIQGWLESCLVRRSNSNNCSAGHHFGFKVSPNENLSRNLSSARRCQPRDCEASIATDSELLLVNSIKSTEIAEASENPQVDFPRDDQTADGTSKLRIRGAKPANMVQAHHDAEKFARLLPFVMHHLEIQLVGIELRNRLLPNVNIRNWNLLVEAITAPSAMELSSNKRLAFLGNAVLEFLITRQLFANHSIWPAGYLSAKKKLIVSNSHLSRMALDVGLDKFVISDPFIPSAWKQPCISNVSTDDVESARSVSKGVLADAVEALIGVAYLDGQYENAFECSQIFLPEIMAHSVRSPCSPAVLGYNKGNSIRFDPTHFAQLEELIGYKFRNNALLAEAMTHPSYEQDPDIGSYERLAFLGNAVLSMVVIDSLSGEKQPLSRNQMHLLRTATINNGFLAFTCLETSLKKEYIDIQLSASSTSERVHCDKNITLWGYLRYGRPELVVERNSFLEKHAVTCQLIRLRLASDRIYPWLGLAKLEPNSDLSDIVQAIFGAVFCDSNGDMRQCALLAEKFRILSTLSQLLQRKVDVLHPKTRLHELAGDQRVTYMAKLEPSGNEYHCVVQMNGKVIAEAQGGSCREEIIIRAAELAIMSLERTSTERAATTQKDSSVEPVPPDLTRPLR